MVYATSKYNILLKHYLDSYLSLSHRRVGDFLWLDRVYQADFNKAPLNQNEQAVLQEEVLCGVEGVEGEERLGVAVVLETGVAEVVIVVVLGEERLVEGVMEGEEIRTTRDLEVFGEGAECYWRTLCTLLFILNGALP